MLGNYFDNTTFDMNFVSVNNTKEFSLHAKESGRYFLYLITTTTNLMDKAGNVANVANLYPEMLYYTCVRYIIDLEVDSSKVETAMKKLLEMIGEDDYICENKECNYQKNIFQLRNYYLISNLNSITYTKHTADEITKEFERILKDSYGIEGVSLVISFNPDVSGSKIMFSETFLQLEYDGIMHSSIIDIAIIINAPIILTGSNLDAKLSLEYGSEVGNVGLSFKGEDTGEIEVYTLITLNGVKVKEIDTSVAGVYSFIQVAKDSSGRTARIVREITVKENEEIEELVMVKEEIIEEVKIITPVVVYEEIEEVEKVERKEISKNSMVKTIQKKTKVKGYKKKKLYKEEKGTHKDLHNKKLESRLDNEVLFHAKF